MEEAYRSHKRLWDNQKTVPSDSHKMVLFYAVECGLKYCYMRKEKIECTETSGNSKKSVTSFNHKFSDLLSELQINATVPDIKKKGQRDIYADELHQVWRYGKKLDENDERPCMIVLESILNELNIKIG